MADKGKGFTDHIVDFLQYVRPVSFEQSAYQKLNIVHDKLRLIRDEDEFLNKPLVSVSTELKSTRKETSVKSLGNFYRPCIKNVLKTTLKHDGAILVNSNYGTETAEKLGAKLNNNCIYSCNCGAYVYFIQDGKRVVLHNQKISREATDAVLGLLNGDDNIITIHGQNKSYTTERFAENAGGKLYKAFGWFMSAKKRVYALLNKQIFNVEGIASDAGFEGARDSNYGITISPVVQSSYILSDSKIVSGYNEKDKVLFPILKTASYAERQQIISQMQLQSITNTILKLATAPEETRKKFENEIDLLITSQGVRIVPKGCSKIGAISRVGKKMEREEHSAIFGGGPEDFSLQLSLGEAYAAVMSKDPSNFIKISETFDNDYHVTAFEPQNKYGIARTLTSSALAKMTDKVNKNALEKAKAEAIEKEINENLPKFLERNPSATPEKIEAFKKLVASSVHTTLSEESKTKVENYRSAGFKDAYGRIKKLANPKEGGPKPTL